MNTPQRKSYDVDESSPYLAALHPTNIYSSVSSLDDEDLFDGGGNKKSQKGGDGAGNRWAGSPNAARRTILSAGNTNLNLFRQTRPEKSNFPVLTLKNERCQCDILQAGACIISFRVDGVEQLWMSGPTGTENGKNTSNTGYMAGGISLAFPQHADANDEQPQTTATTAVTEQQLQDTKAPETPQRKEQGQEQQQHKEPTENDNGKNDNNTQDNVNDKVLIRDGVEGEQGEDNANKDEKDKNGEGEGQREQSQQHPPDPINPPPVTPPPRRPVGVGEGNDIDGAIQQQQESKNPLDYHGFARDRTWEIYTMEDHMVVLRLNELSGSSPTAAATAASSSAWPYSFRLQYTILLQDTSLSMTLRVTNCEGAVSWSWSGSINTYIRFKRSERVELLAFKGTTYIDKADPTRTLKTQKGPFNIHTEALRTGKDCCQGKMHDGYVNRVYLAPTPNNYAFAKLSSGREVLHLSQNNFPDAGIYSPWQTSHYQQQQKEGENEQQQAEQGANNNSNDNGRHNTEASSWDPKGYKYCICFQSVVSKTNAITLLPGHSWEGSQTITVPNRA